MIATAPLDPSQMAHQRLPVTALAGMWLGQRVRGRIGAAGFRRWFFICLLGLGVQLMARAFV